MQLGVVRKLDALGRVSIPIYFRKLLNLEAGDRVQIIFNDDQIIIKPLTKEKEGDDSGKTI